MGRRGHRVRSGRDMVKKLLISGCSYGVVYSEIQEELKELFSVDEVVNISRRGSGPDRQIRGVIEWIAQNGKPEMVIMPVSHYNRFDLPIAKDFDPLHNLHARHVWGGNDHLDGLHDMISEDDFKAYLKHGTMIHQAEHTTHDYLFVKLITFQGYLENNGIRHLIFDTGNDYKRLWMEHLSIDDKNNSGYQPGMKKRDLIENCKGIYKLLSFCSNKWMYDNMDPADQNVPDLDQQILLHHDKDMTLKLMKHLKKEGAIYG